VETLESLHKLSFIFVMLGGLSWGLIAFLDFNLIHFIFISVPALERLIYLIIGLSALSEVIIHRGVCRLCQGSAIRTPEHHVSI
jgi:uncharacterized protein